MQRRRAFRVAAEVPFSFTVIDASETDLKGRKVTSVETQDLSVSGLSFHTSLPLRIGDKLEIKLQLSSSVNPHKPSSESVSASGWVVRSEPDEQDEESGSLVAVAFLMLEPKEQNQLLLFLAEPRTSEADMVWIG